MADDNNNDQLNLEEVVEIAPDDLSDEQRTFLESNSDNLTDEQRENFGIEKPTPPPTEPEVRNKPPDKKPEKPAESPDEIDPDDRVTIAKVVEETVKPIREEVERQRSDLQANVDAKEVDEYVREHPEFEQYRGKILSYMKHPAYQNIPARNIARIVAGDDLMKLGAEKEREAATSANQSHSGGSSTRPAGGEGKNWLEASQEEFQKKRSEVMGMRV